MNLFVVEEKIRNDLAVAESLFRELNTHQMENPQIFAQIEIQILSGYRQLLEEVSEWRSALRAHEAETRRTAERTAG